MDSSPSLSSNKGLSIIALSNYGLAVHFIDVDQGDSILAKSDGHYMLIDTDENDQADIVVSYLRAWDVAKLDYVIGTHPHSDHIGGLDKIVDTSPADKVILPPVEHTTKAFEGMLDSITSKGLKVTKLTLGGSYDLGDTSFTILSPVRDYGSNLDNQSVSVRLTYSGNSLVICSDAESQAEKDIIKNDAVLKADVLKADHHDSNISTSDAFLKKIPPLWVVIQCGRGSSYDHPHKETMERLKKVGCRVLRTDEEGTITALSNDKTITWSTGTATAPGTSADNGGNQAAATPNTGNGVAAGSEAGNPSTHSGYVINTNANKFYRPDCAPTTQMKSENRKDMIASRNELIQGEYESCKQCKS